MESSLLSNTNQVLLDSILAMDNAGMVAMFEALVASGLKGFLGCSSAIFENALVEFFHNASVRDGMVVSTVLGKPVAISEELFASTFALPLEGLTDLHEVPQDFVLEERRAFSHDDTLPHVSDFFKLLQKRWADVCIEAVEFFVPGKLLPVGSLNFCRTLTVVEPDQYFGYRRPTVTTWGWSQLCTDFLRYSLFGGLQTVNFSIFRSAFVSVRPVLGAASIFDTVVRIAPVSFSTSIVFDPDVQMDDIQHSDSSSSSSSSNDQLDFHVSSPMDEDTQLSLPPPVDQTPLPTASLASISESFDDLRASISRLIANKTNDSRRMGDSQSEVMSKLNDLEKALLDPLSQQHLAF
ncbi:Mediator of RNA polymerase II transcription subunit [Dorcoceras hygrometricum]|uniref:Mediator of RNA polymerase II transcription subunit n=1 Tax=Dorcoceras hygrometricum TaxID=472368 RepID=A0A2Z7B6F4_9LAMI|nr:Mediator of RNA polymerase II transcription subunit [Dorcoceras hygrometricum]